MPTWKMYKGESKTFEGTVLLATAAGMVPTNYDITQATLGFDMGRSMGNWTIRLDSLYGSLDLATNYIQDGDFANGTFGWAGEPTQYPAASYSWPIGTQLAQLGTFPHMLGFILKSATNFAMITNFSDGTCGTGGYNQGITGMYYAEGFVKFINSGVLSIASLTLGYVALSDITLAATNNWVRFSGTSNSGNLMTNPSILFYGTAPSGGASKTGYLANLKCYRIAATSAFQIMTGSMGVYRFSFKPEDTQNLTATSYYFDIWMRTPSLDEYVLTIGTLQLLPVVGTF